MEGYTRLLNDGWLFQKGEAAAYAPVTLPHDWLIYDPKNFYESGVGTYLRTWDAQGVEAGQRVFLHFDGVYMDCVLFVNGKQAGEWKYGYTAFEFEVTDYIYLDRPNEFRLTVNYQSPNSRWYSGAGIYRDVTLKVKNPYHFVSDGIYITTNYTDGVWSYTVSAEVETGGKPYELRHTLLGAEEGTESWDIGHPRLYTLRSELLVDGIVSDTTETRFGFRRIAFTPDQGFYLNGIRLKLNGVCLHHDLGGFGAAVHPDAIRRQLSILRDMGVNAVRTAHNPPAKVFMEICDELGMLVVSELCDMWELPKTRYDYARFFPDWVERDTASWVRRDRNHPSLIMWSVGNEVYDTHASAEKGGALLQRLASYVRRHDPDHHAPVTFGSNYMPWENTQKCADLIKLPGYNYAEAYYEAHHAAHPDWIIYGSETCSTVQSRAVYHFPLHKSILADDDLQCSSLGNSATSWGAKSVEACIQSDDDAPFSLGQFLWAGQDYIGEPTPYHTKNSYFGHIDTAGFPKDSYYIFQAAWTDWRQKPMVHLFPYWDFNPGQNIDLRVCSNAPRVELYLDGESLGAAELRGRPAGTYPESEVGERCRRFVADYRIPYRPGVLRALAYDLAGNVIAKVERSSFGDAVSLHTQTEHYGELRFVAITALDAAGREVENANHRVRVRVEKGELLFLDNGDSTDYEPYQGDCRLLFSGKLLAVVRAVCEEEPIVKVTSITDTVPIRKIELRREGFTFRAVLHPENASYRDLEWRLTDAGGIDSPLGKLDIAEDGLSATLIPRGDGEVYVRCMCSNGKPHPALISQLDVRLQGYGKPFLDPYEFVSGGLYNYANREPTNGNERGVATLRDGETHVGFRDLDFGSYGSDEISLPLFPLGHAPFDFEIWEGIPAEGGEKLLLAHYDKGSVWNTYVEVTYKLPKRLRGITSLCLVFRQKVHVKGFCFTRPNRAFEEMEAASCEHIYGDNFTLKADAVEGIGNNVTLEFGALDFGEEGTGSVSLCWRSRPENSSVQLCFSDGEGESKQMVELGKAEEYQGSVFSLEARVRGKKNVSLVFLPGSDIDLRSVQFHR